MIDARAFSRAAKVFKRSGFERTAGTHTSKALRLAGNAVRRHVRAKAKPHKKTGRLNRFVSVKPKGAGMDLAVTVHAGGSVAHLIAGGTKPHDIVPLRAHSIAIAAPGRFGGIVAFAARVHHPGTRGDPFFMKGVRAARGEVQGLVDEAGRELARDLVRKIVKR